MKATTEGFRIVEGVRIPSGTTLTVDRSYGGTVDMIGKRCSEKTYKEHFAPKPEVKEDTKKKATKSEE